MHTSRSSKGSRVISVSEESVIEQEPFHQRVEVATGWKTRGDKRQKSYLSLVFSLYSDLQFLFPLQLALFIFSKLTGIPYFVIFSLFFTICNLTMKCFVEVLANQIAIL